MNGKNNGFITGGGGGSNHSNSTITAKSQYPSMPVAPIGFKMPTPTSPTKTSIQPPPVHQRTLSKSSSFIDVIRLKISNLIRMHINVLSPFFFSFICFYYSSSSNDRLRLSD